MDELFKWLSANATASIIAIIAFGALVLVFVIAVFQGRAVSFWPPKIGAKPVRSKPVGEVKLVSKEVLAAGTDASASSSTETATSDSLPIDGKLIQVSPPIDPARFRVLEFPRNDPITFYQWPYTPLGLTVVYEVPFFIQPVQDSTQKVVGHHTIDVKPSKDNSKTYSEVSARVRNATAVYFLLSSGNGWVTWDGIQFLGRGIGYIDLVFTDGTTQKVDLVLGKNIREWAFGWNANLVNKVDFSLTRPAWVSHDQSRRIDFMRIAVADAPKNLETIRITAKFEDDYPSRSVEYPAIIISAITCDRK